MRYRFKTTASGSRDNPVVPDEDSDNSRESADKHWQERDKNKKREDITFQLKSRETRWSGQRGVKFILNEYLTEFIFLG